MNNKDLIDQQIRRYYANRQIIVYDPYVNCTGTGMGFGLGWLIVIVAGIVAVISIMGW